MSDRTTQAETNRATGLSWIDAFNLRDNRREAEARTSDYIAHTPESIGTEALDADGWARFLEGFLEGFPDLHLEVQDTSADEHMIAQRILFTGTHTGDFRGLPPTDRSVGFSGIEINRMVDERGHARRGEHDLASEDVRVEVGRSLDVPGHHEVRADEAVRGRWKV